jgi:hypothetical protein
MLNRARAFALVGLGLLALATWLLLAGYFTPALPAG